MPANFFNLYRHNFVRVAVAVPEVKVADPQFNAAQTISLLRQAAERKALIVVFPELGLSAYSCEDLFQQQALLDGCIEALSEVLAASREVPAVAAVGLPLRIDGLLYNCAAVIHRGAILGVVPKTYLPNYREFYEARQFTSGRNALREKIECCGQRDVPFGPRLLFQTDDQPLLTFHVEICEDLWVPIPPSSFAALAGASVLINLSASNITVTKDDYRRQLVANQSARCLAAYVYCAAGYGESTTDLAWDGHGMIYENGALIGETEHFRYRSQLAYGDIDLDHLTQDRMRQNSFGQAIDAHRVALREFHTVHFSAALPIDGILPPARRYERFPYVPSDAARRDERCREVFEIQVQGLVKRLSSINADKIVLGVSGGLDSTHALLVCARAMDVLELPRANILAYTMPGFATSARTLEQARRLMTALGASAHEIDIRPACIKMLADIGHPYAAGKPVYDLTFENVQAGERTSHLFRLGNQHDAPVVGTSDLSELALGWCTYGVGDHMAHYHVNAGVPKTLLQYLIRWIAETHQLGAEPSADLIAVLETTISPELVPGEENGQPAQRSEAVIGPYELQDFFLYYALRFGYTPAKIAFLAWGAWRDRTLGGWPDVPEDSRRQYTLAEIKRWLAVFVERFFKSSQYKRSCIANAPKVGSGGSLSPRGDYRAPSDSEATVWLADLARIPDSGEPPAGGFAESYPPLF
ncbi:MAG TPA: NAD(+) synthase [Burkholderiales bacterium]|nr:NAD(+) synthase [Burkholderiales bacterium]